MVCAQISIQLILLHLTGFYHFVGVTCLFIASKIEEIYPPKLQEFAYVTDGACTEEDILAMELVVLKQLNWSLSPKTPNAWTKLLLQIDERRKRQEVTENVNSLIKPSYCGLTHSKTMHLVDLCILDISSLNFSYASLAASALYFVQDSPLPSGNFVLYNLENDK